MKKMTEVNSVVANLCYINISACGLTSSSADMKISLNKNSKMAKKHFILSNNLHKSYNQQTPFH